MYALIAHQPWIHIDAEQFHFKILLMSSFSSDRIVCDRRRQLRLDSHRQSSQHTLILCFNFIITIDLCWAIFMCRQVNVYAHFAWKSMRSLACLDWVCVWRRCRDKTMMRQFSYGFRLFSLSHISNYQNTKLSRCAQNVSTVSAEVKGREPSSVVRRRIHWKSRQGWKENKLKIHRSSLKFKHDSFFGRFGFGWPQRTQKSSMSFNYNLILF